MLGRAMKMAFWVTYDHLGKLIVASFLWSVVALTPLLLGISLLVSGGPGMLLLAAPFALLSVAVLVPVMTAGMAALAKQLIDTRDGQLGTFFEGIRRYAGCAAALGAIYTIATICLASSVFFYSQRLGPSLSWLGYALSGLALWILAFGALTALYAFPALVQKNERPLTTLRLAAMLVLDNPGFSIGLALMTLFFVAISVLALPLAPFILPGWLVALVSSAYEMLARKYAAADAAQGLRETVEARRKRYEYENVHDDYLNRGLRDALFPWKG